MSDADNSEDDVALAGEYALHLMPPAERQAFEARLESEPALRALLRDWEENFASLADEVAPVAPPPELKRRLEQTLFAAPAPRRRWSWALLGGLAAAAVVAAVLLTGTLREAPPGYVAEIAAEDRSLVIEASFDADTATLAVERVAGQAAAGRALELWLIAEAAPTPVSLGVLPEGPSGRISVPEALVPALAGGTLAVSDEPPGGSPTGQPTGAVLAVGPVTTL